MMSERKHSKILQEQYVEDYLKHLQYPSEVERRPEKENEVKEGNGIGSEDKTPQLIPINLPSTAITVMAYSIRLTQPMLLLENNVSAEILLPSLYKVKNLLQMPIRAFEREIRRISSFYIPLTTSTFYSWFMRIKPISLPEQLGVTAYTFKDLLRLTETLPTLPKIAENIITTVKTPVPIPNMFLIQNEVRASLREVETMRFLRDKTLFQRLRGRGLLEVLFPDDEEKFRRFRGVSGEYSGEPIIIILPENADYLWYLFRIICREFYREVRGVYPEPVVVLDKGYDIWLRYPGDLSGKIVILHKRHVERDENKEWFRRRLQELFARGLGFLIILAEDVNETTAFIKELSKPYIPLIIDIHLVPEFSYFLKTLANILSAGFGIPYNEVVKVDDLGMRDKVLIISVGEVLPRPDIMVARVDRMYRDFLNELLLSDYLVYVRRDVSERESEDHIAMKILAIKYVSEKFGIRPEDVECTFEVGDKVIADVYIKEKALAIECETLLGVAPAPILKIFESVRKYVEHPLTKPVNEIWVIVRNWIALLNLGDLLWAEAILRKELGEQGKRVKFFIPDIYGKSLKPIDEIAEVVFKRGTL